MTPRRGFSLIEVVLAIALSIALVALLGMAIDLHLVRLDSSRTSIEQAQIARAIFDRITTDLRGTTTAPAQDMSELQNLADSSAQFNVDEVDSGAEEETESQTTTTAATNQVPIGLNGLIDSITIDTRQLTQTLLTPTPGAAPVARIDVGWTQIGYGMSLVPGTPGLIRTVTPCDVVRWRYEQSVEAPVVEPIAAEVRAIQFRYWNGTELVEIWDMAEQQVLPTAVEIRIELAPIDATDADNSSTARQQTHIYRRVVRIPAAADEATATAGAAASGASTGSGTGTGTGGGTGAGTGGGFGAGGT
jgi:Tfp pilus assembly protein PilV